MSAFTETKDTVKSSPPPHTSSTPSFAWLEVDRSAWPCSLTHTGSMSEPRAVPVNATRPTVSGWGGGRGGDRQVPTVILLTLGKGEVLFWLPHRRSHGTYVARGPWHSVTGIDACDVRWESPVY
uniref:Uncharacterized protein n=1 Tax=Knipowitschia caucasica TaxID=637954 RepID=A0AAV2JJA5_KNICA